MHSIIRDDAQQRAYLHIKSSIIGFLLKPNERLIASKVAEELSISRTPVREALSRLEQEGLVRKTGGWGFTVRDVGITDVQEIFKVREVLEVLAVSEAIEHMDSATTKQLEALLQQAGKCLHEPAEFISFNRGFYTLIAVTTRNELLRNLLGFINDRVEMIGAMTVRYHSGRPGEILLENRELLRALKKGDKKRSESAVRSHIQNGRDHALQIVNAQLFQANLRNRK